MIKINYHDFCKKTIEECRKLNVKPNLLLHSCCGPCSSYVLDYLNAYFNITVIYYNPNIDTSEEYYFRAEEQRRLLNEMGLKINVIVKEYNPSDYYSKIKGLENEKEGGERCKQCFELRLEETAKYAAQHGFDYFTTTLSISPHKNSEVLNYVGLKYAEIYNVKYLLSDFKKNEGYKKSVELSKKYNMYRQDYCGCIFSKLEKNIN